MSKKYVEKYVDQKKHKKYGPETASKKASRGGAKKRVKMDPEGDPKGTFSRARCVACLERSRQLVAQSIMRRTSTGPGPMTMTMFTQSHRPEFIFGKMRVGATFLKL